MAETKVQVDIENVNNIVGSNRKLFFLLKMMKVPN